MTSISITINTADLLRSLAKNFPGPIGDIFAERANQVEQGYDQANDDATKPKEWVAYIDKQIGKAFNAQLSRDADDFRDRMVKIAALALAALESIDRQVAAKK
jgi:hypothetical protein